MNTRGHEAFLHGARGARVVVLEQDAVSYLLATCDVRAAIERCPHDGIRAQLTALSVAALEARDQRQRPTSGVGRKSAPGSEVEPRSPRTITSRQAADQLNITTRAVITACHDGRLTGHQDSEHRWHIDAASVAAMQTRP